MNQVLKGFGGGLTSCDVAPGSQLPARGFLHPPPLTRRLALEPLAVWCALARDVFRLGARSGS